MTPQSTLKRHKIGKKTAQACKKVNSWKWVLRLRETLILEGPGSQKHPQQPTKGIQKVDPKSRLPKGAKKKQKGSQDRNPIPGASRDTRLNQNIIKMRSQWTPKSWFFFDAWLIVGSICRWCWNRFWNIFLEWFPSNVATDRAAASCLWPLAPRRDARSAYWLDWNLKTRKSDNWPATEVV